MADENKIQEIPVPEKLDNLHAAAMKPLKLNAVSFVNPVLGWFLEHWKLTLFLILISIIGIEYLLIKHYKAEANASDIAITTLTTSLNTANQALIDQNNKIDAAKKDGNEKQKQLDDLQKILKKKAIADKKIIDDLRNKPIGTTCEDALKDMVDYIGTLKWEN